MKAVQKEVEKMNTDKIYAEAIANQYSVKTATKVTALKKADKIPSLKFKQQNFSATT